MARTQKDPPPSKDADLAAEKIGPYQIGEPILTGENETICRAEDTRSGEPVYLAYLSSLDQELVDRFQRRAETLSQVNHPVIAPIEDFGVSESGRPYAVMPFLPLNSLADVQTTGEPAKNVSESLRLARQLADGLHAAHLVGLTHANLKPAHIFIQEDGRPLLLDLLCSPSRTAGDPPRSEFLDYLAPEQLQGKSATARSNIFTLGILIYELLAGHRPRIPRSEWSVFEKSASQPREIPLEEARQGLSGATYHLVRECLWPQEWSRFETMAEMVAAINAAIQAEQERPSAPGQLTASRRPRWLVPVIVVVILLLITAGVFFLRGG